MGKAIEKAQITTAIHICAGLNQVEAHEPAQPIDDVIKIGSIRSPETDFWIFSLSLRRLDSGDYVLCATMNGGNDRGMTKLSL